jgi:hypothetical protein
MALFNILMKPTLTIDDRNVGVGMGITQKYISLTFGWILLFYHKFWKTVSSNLL